MQKQLFNASIIFLGIILSSCVSDQKKDPSQSVLPVVNKAIAMTIPHETEKAFSLYGVRLGESRSSVEKKYFLSGCRSTKYFFQCVVLLDLTGVDGIMSGDRATVFINFKNDHVNNMGIAVLPSSQPYTREILNKIYSLPDLIGEKKTTWLNASGSVIFEPGALKGHPSTIRYESGSGNQKM